MKRIVLILILILMPINVKAASDNFKISCEKTSFKEFAEFTCRTSVNSAFLFDRIEFIINTSEGLSLDDVRTNYSALWQVEINENIVTATTKRNQLVSGLQEFGIFLFQAMDPGNQTIDIKNVILSNSSNQKTLTINDVAQEIKVLSSENGLRGIFINKEIIKDFTPQITNYKIEITEDQTSIDLGAIALDESAIISGIGTIELELNTKEFILPITVKSADGTNRVYLLFLTRKNTSPSSIIASNIKLTDNNKKVIDFKFDPNKYEYQIEVENNIKAVDVNITLDNKDLSLVKNFGSRKVDIIDGDNLILLKIKAKNGEVKTYVLTITKRLSNKSSNCYLDTLNVIGYNLKFNKKVKHYSLSLNKKESELKIEAIPDHYKAKITILGNENLDENSVVKIIVVAENGSKMTYQIMITYQEANYHIYYSLLALILIIICLSLRKLKKRNKGVSISTKLIENQEVKNDKGLRAPNANKTTDNIKKTMVNRKPKLNNPQTKKTNNSSKAKSNNYKKRQPMQKSSKRKPIKKK